MGLQAKDIAGAKALWLRNEEDSVKRVEGHLGPITWDLVDLVRYLNFT